MHWVVLKHTYGQTAGSDFILYYVVFLASAMVELEINLDI
jgi:hypothetical protein